MVRIHIIHTIGHPRTCALEPGVSIGDVIDVGGDNKEVSGGRMADGRCLVNGCNVCIGRAASRGQGSGVWSVREESERASGRVWRGEEKARVSLSAS